MSDKRKDGVIITIKGLQLVTKLTAGAGALVLSAVKVGVGILPEDTDPLTLDDIISYKMDGVIADCGYDSETKNGYVVMQLSNDGLENGFVMTEIGLYAVDPDLGEILYAYVDMSDDPNYIMPAENGRHKLVQLKLHVIVGATKEIEASINPAAQITKEVFDREIQKIVTPDWDDTGEVDGIESFTDFMDSFVKGTSIYQFLTNFKAGLKYVLHTGKLVNSGMCETPGEFALDAAFGKTLQDQITGLYSDIGYKKLQFGQYVFISHAPGEYEIEIPYPHPFNTMPVIVISLGIPHKNFEGYGITHLSICDQKNTKNKFVVYLKTEYVSDCPYSINWVAMT